MRIGIYAYPNEGGGGRYFRDLLDTLPHLGSRHEYFLYLDKEDRYSHRKDGHPWHLRILSIARKGHWQHVQVDLRQRLHRDCIDLFHSQRQRFPVATSCKTVATIHDAIPALAAQGTLSPSTRSVHMQQFWTAARYADRVIVSSCYTKRLFVERLHLSPEKVTQIYPGTPRMFHPVSQDQTFRMVRHRFRIHRPYLLSVGALIPRKNYPLLIRAFQKQLWKQYDLVIVGKLWWWEENVLQSIRGDPAIHYLGFVSDAALLNLYAAEERFGFQPLEAMACGTPVVAFQMACLLEVIGDAGFWVTPRSPQGLAEALEQVLTDRPLQEQFRARGFTRIQPFRWDTTPRRH